MISANTGNLTLRATNSYPGMASIDFAVGADILLGGSEDALVSFPGNAVTMSHGMWEMRWEVSQPIQRVWAGDAQTLWHCDWVSGSAPSQEMASAVTVGWQQVTIGPGPNDVELSFVISTPPSPSRSPSPTWTLAPGPKTATQSARRTNPFTQALTPHRFRRAMRMIVAFAIPD